MSTMKVIGFSHKPGENPKKNVLYHLNATVILNVKVHITVYKVPVKSTLLHPKTVPWCRWYFQMYLWWKN